MSTGKAKQRVKTALSGLLILTMLALSVRVTEQYRAQEDDDSSSAVIESNDWTEVFDNTGAHLDPNDKQYFLFASGDPADNFSYKYTTSLHYYISNALTSKRKLSGLCNWEFTYQADVTKGSAFRTITSLNFSGITNHSLTYRVGNMGTSKSSFFNTENTGPNPEIKTEYELTDAQIKGFNNLKVSYNAATRTYTATYLGKTITYKDTSFLWNDLPADKSINVSINGDMYWELAKGPTVPADAKVQGRFVNARYTKYSPKFISTVLLDPATGQEFLDPTLIKPGQEVIVKAVVQNMYKSSGSGNYDGDSVPVHIKMLGNDSKYPTFGIKPVSSGQEIYIDDSTTPLPDSGTIDIAGDGIPATCKAGGTTIRYRAVIEDTKGKAVTIGQQMSDDFFQSKQYSGATLIPELPLEPKDPEDEEGVPGQDYHYYRTPPNKNGWNNTPVDLDFYKGDFNQFLVEKPQDDGNYSEVVKLNAQKDVEKVTSFTDETTGDNYRYQALDTLNERKSSAHDDLIKIDLTAPSVTVNAKEKELKLDDSLSGIWKLYRKDSSGKFIPVKDYTGTLTDGNGSQSETVTGITNGIYKVMDAAGNLSEPVNVYTTKPPVIEPSGPGSEPLNPPDITEDPEGLRHAVYYDLISKQVKAPYDFDGKLDGPKALEFIRDRYNITSNAQNSDVTEEIKILQNGKDITSAGFPTNKTGRCTIVYKVTDAEGNTSTLYLEYQLAENMEVPQIISRPEGKPIIPVEVREEPDGTKHAFIQETVTEYIKNPPDYSGIMTAQDAKSFLNKRYLALSSIDQVKNLRFEPVHIYDLNNGRKEITLSGIDMTAPGKYLMVYKVWDSYGNSTTVELTYILEKKAPLIAGEFNEENDSPDKTPRLPANVKNGSGTKGPQTGDSIWNSDCKVHLLLLALTLFAAGWFLLRKLYDTQKGETGRAGDVLDMTVYLGCIAAGTLLFIFRQCFYDLPFVMALMGVCITGGLFHRVKCENVPEYDHK